MLRALWTKFDRDWGWNLARLLAFTLLEAQFAVLCLVLVVLALVVRLLGPNQEQAVIRYTVGLLPDRITYSAALAFEHSLRHTSAIFLVLGALIALWYGSRFFVVMESCLCVIFQRLSRPYIAQNRTALVMLLLFALFLPVILASSAVVPYLGFTAVYPAEFRSHAILSQITWLPLVGFGASFTADFLFLLIAFAWLTPGGVRWRDALPGALLSAALTQGYLLIFPFYVRYVLQPGHYGAIAGIILVGVVFIYAYALFIVIGAELAAWLNGARPATRDAVSRLVEPSQRLGDRRVTPAHADICADGFAGEPSPDGRARPRLLRVSRPTRPA